jgi:hypothetical protein
MEHRLDELSVHGRIRIVLIAGENLIAWDEVLNRFPSGGRQQRSSTCEATGGYVDLMRPTERGGPD